MTTALRHLLLGVGIAVLVGVSEEAQVLGGGVQRLGRLGPRLAGRLVFRVRFCVFCHLIGM